MTAEAPDWSLMREAAEARAASSKEVKIKLAYDVMVKLHSLRLLEGRTLGAIVGDALACYLRDAYPETFGRERP